MDRKTRIANLRKLQLPGTIKQSNCNVALSGANVSSAMTTTITSAQTTVSKYFQTPSSPSSANILTPQQQQQQKQLDCNIDKYVETSESQPRAFKRTKLDAFVYNDPKQTTNCLTPCKPLKNDDDFINTPKLPKKKAPCQKKLKLNSNKSVINNISKNAKNKKQSIIKSAFFRNEQMFAEITAQHCAVEHFDSNEIQMALALSKSEVNNYEENFKTEGAEETHNCEDIDNIREKLQKYGFRTASKKDYQTFAASFWSASNRRKGKWANKFTALTLRNPVLQNEKLHQKIERTLKQYEDYSRRNLENPTAPFSYTMISTLLKQCHHHCVDESFMKKCRQDEHINLEEYFVKELFMVNVLPCGYLLKDWSMIPGRIISPTANDKRHLKSVKRLQKSYKDLEDYFAKVKKEEIQAQKPKTNTLSQDEIMSEGVTKVVQVQSSNSENENEVKQLQQSIPQNIVKDLMFESPFTNKTDITCDSLSSQRCLTSPDLFADSDVEMSINIITQPKNVEKEYVETENLNNKSIGGLNGVTTYELFTSDDVKNFTTMHSLVNGNVDATLKSPKRKIENTNIILDANEMSLNCDYTNIKEEQSQNILQYTEGIKNTKKSPNLYKNIDEDENTYQELSEKYLGSMSTKVHKETQNHISNTIKMNDFKTTSSLALSLLSRESADEDEDIFQKLRAKHFGSMSIKIHEKTENNTTTSATSLSLSSPSLNSDVNRNSSIRSNISIDLTQDKEPTMLSNVYNSSKRMDDDNLIILSDEEINYSIWKSKCQKSNSIIMEESQTTSNIEINENFKSFDFEGQQNVFSPTDIFQKSRENYFGSMSIKVHAKTENNTTTTSSLSLSSPSLLTLSSNVNPNPLIRSNTSIDLTQDEEPTMCSNVYNSSKRIDDDDLIILSDDDINYSIWEAKRQESNLIKTEELQITSNIEINENLKAFDFVGERNVFSSTSAEKSLLYLEKQYKSLDEHFQTPFRKSSKDVDFTFLNSPSERKTNMMQQQQSKEKFHIFLSNENFLIPSPPSLSNEQETETDEPMDFREFDRQFLYENSHNINSNCGKIPNGLDELLNGDLKFSPTQSTDHTTPKKCKQFEKMDKMSDVQKVEIQDKTFLVRIDNSLKPDFTQLTDNELLKRLYDFGIKPLKRRHSIKLLEYIYNQTHPIMIDNCNVKNVSNSHSEHILPSQSPLLSSSSSLLVCDNNIKKINIVENCPNMRSSRRLFLCDTNGATMLRSRIDFKPELNDEIYILQTNINKKTPQPLLPLHIAWYNLICSNPILYETVLKYEPIDLQDIYLFLKNLGYRYDPKDLKKFFDRRCIIFRYDLSAAAYENGVNHRGRQRNGHIRKTKSKS